MPDIMRIKDVARPVLDEEFLTSDEPSLLDRAVADGDMEPAGVNFDTSALDIVLTSTLRDFERYDAAMDAAMVVGLHKALPFTRQHAADRNLWTWLGVVHAPDFVAWRWKPSGVDNTRSAARFDGDRVRQTFARLWWAAELTRDAEDYSLTNRLFYLPGFQDVYEAIFGRAIANFRPAVAAFLEMVQGKKEKFVRDFAKELGYAFSLSLIETMSQQELVEFMSGLVQEMEAR